MPRNSGNALHIFFFVQRPYNNMAIYIFWYIMYAEMLHNQSRHTHTIHILYL